MDKLIERFTQYYFVLTFNNLTNKIRLANEYNALMQLQFVFNFGLFCTQ
jgi:hypothetical protein